MSTSPLVVARVLLRSARGERPGVDVPISAATIERLAPSPQAVDAVAEHLRGAGFALVGKPGMTIGISGSKALFERHFGVRLERGADGAYTVRQAGAGGSRARGAADTSADPTSIPTDHLPPPVRAAVSQIALEAAVSLDEPGVDP